MVKHLAPIKMFGPSKADFEPDRVAKDLSVEVEKVDDETENADDDTTAETTASTPAETEVTAAKD